MLRIQLFSLQASLMISFVMPESSQFCPLSYKYIGPICGTDGVTYPTWCELEAARIFNPSLEMAYISKCSLNCDYTWAPVCGSDMETYGNLCWFELTAKRPGNERLKMLHMGECMIRSKSNNLRKEDYDVASYFNDISDEESKKGLELLGLTDEKEEDFTTVEAKPTVPPPPKKNCTTKKPKASTMIRILKGNSKRHAERQRKGKTIKTLQ